ncbi:hypothetical protein DdX_19382 [Ditylenchus destructor]|uniref:Uncharacterized protein n=1 Tax=Ditylenchus destructor TaxID=166010 RepID=A0AAD4QXB2_9BILA|nr:hypothetical protein DdX_19382 [Ditylenchus destructor]
MGKATKAKQSQSNATPVSTRGKAEASPEHPLNLLQSLMRKTLNDQQKQLLLPAMNAVENYLELLEKNLNIQTELIKEMKEQRKEFAEMKRDIEILKGNRPFQTASSSQHQPPPHEISAEEKERKRSLVLIGLPEPDKDESATVRNKRDKEAVQRILEKLSIEAEAEAVYRMGRETTDSKGNTRPRLVKVRLPTSSFQRQALRNFGQCRNQIRAEDEFAQLLVRPSLTGAERAAEIELNAKLRQIRTENPDKKYMIKRGKIVEIHDDGRFTQVGFH